MSPLRRRMIDDMQIRNLSPRTQGTYVRQVAQFSRHFGKSPDLLGPAEIRAWQIHLTQDKRLAARSITVAVSALRFFYTVTLCTACGFWDAGLNPMLPLGDGVQLLVADCFWRDEPVSLDEPGASST